MDASKVTLVICLTALIVVGVNAALYAMLRRGNEAGQIELFRRAMGRARSPWQDEEKALQELSQKVAELKKGENVIEGSELDEGVNNLDR